jgi:hypothetical protein
LIVCSGLLVARPVEMVSTTLSSESANQWIFIPLIFISKGLVFGLWMKTLISPNQLALHTNFFAC